MKTKFVLYLLFLPLFASAQTYTYSTLTKFPATSKDSAVNPWEPITDSAGNIYGLSFYGGKYNQGTLWKATKSGTLSIIYNFGVTSTDAERPIGTLLRDSSGNFYGESESGGTSNFGTVFKITSTGKETILWNFTVELSAAGLPSLARDSAGNLYGFNTSGAGSVFKLTSKGVYTTLYTFCSLTNCDDGMAPVGGPVLKGSKLYGVTSEGGGSTACSPVNGCGTIFEVTTSGVETVLYAFNGGIDASAPNGPLVEDSAGNWYGSSYYGGTGGYGTIFKLSSTNVESILHDFSFCSVCTDGFYPITYLIIDSSDNLYGIAAEGGTNNEGTVFSITTTGVETTIYNQNGLAGLGWGLALDKSGNLYGTTWNGGPNHNGTIYKLTKN